MPSQFWNYVSSGPSTPEFYNDDIPILLLGRAMMPMSGLYDYGLPEEKSLSIC